MVSRQKSDYIAVPQVDFCALTVTLELSHLSKGSNEIRSSDELQWCESEYIQAQGRTSGMMRGMRNIELMCESLEEDRPEDQKEPNSVTRRRALPTLSVSLQVRISISATTVNTSFNACY